MKNVMVTTEHRGVFAGELENEDGTTVDLRNARMCVYWSSDVRGVLGLAQDGPNSKCRITPSVDAVRLHGVTAVVDLTDKAVKAWAKEPPSAPEVEQEPPISQRDLDRLSDERDALLQHDEEIRADERAKVVAEVRDACKRTGWGTVWLELKPILDGEALNTETEAPDDA